MSPVKTESAKYRVAPIVSIGKKEVLFASFLNAIVTVIKWLDTLPQKENSGVFIFFFFTHVSFSNCSFCCWVLVDALALP
jgi:hypothetical protein